METINTITNDKWYTLKVLSNFEDKVKKLIEKKIETEPKYKSFFHEVLISRNCDFCCKRKKRARIRKLYGILICKNEYIQ